MQLQAGYILDALKNTLVGVYAKAEVLPLLESLSFFEVDSLSEKLDNGNPELAVLYNLLSRGLPTRPSIFVEQQFLKALNLGKHTCDNLGNIFADSPLGSNLNADSYFKALHIIDPRIKPEINKFKIEPSFEFDNIGSQFEEDFLFKIAPRVLGSEWFQLLECQRNFTSIANGNTNFIWQRTDFSVEFPYKIEDKKGIVIEVDGSQHWTDPSQIEIDIRRDAAVINVEWFSTLRLQTREWNHINNRLNAIESISRSKFIKKIKDNYNNPLYDSGDGVDALQLALSPFAIARVQKTLLHLLLQGKLKLNAPSWKIAVIERDVPCAAIALSDIKKLIEALYLLKGSTVDLKIDLTIFHSKEFESALLNKVDLSDHLSKIEFVEFSNQKYKENFDLLIDISMLQRPGFSGSETVLQARNRCVIRSSHHIHSKRQFLTSDIINYSPILSRNEETEKNDYDEQKVELLKLFLQFLFRKQDFREGQKEILNRALQGESVIGLLPTGGGKSLTYQLAALLQPGICLVIDPIKSLMKDQFDNLIKNQIDACNFINSSIKTREDKAKELTKLGNGEVLFSFVSPERLQMKEFRDRLSQMHEDKVYFNFCVIDEAHCVSEWGHDFRTSYLSLGKNAMEFCKARNKPSIPLFGLTATASFDVLSDIQRELSGNIDDRRLKEDSVISRDTFNRSELSYQVIDVFADQQNSDNDWQLKEKLGVEKQTTLVKLLRKLPFDDKNNFSGIIFCPHKSWYFGVTDRYKNGGQRKGVYDSILAASIPHVNLGSFMGADSDDENTSESIEQDSILAQDQFVNNKLNLLVSTKAFGMGIDKANVRFTVHFNYPSSIESFVQEAGRAGRDRKDAICYILYNDESVVRSDKKVVEIDRDNLLYFYNASFKGEEKEKSILYELLQSIHTPNKITEIEKTLNEKFGIEFSLSLRKSNYDGIWWITVKGESPDYKYGSIRVYDFLKTTRSANQPLDICNDVLKEIQTYIEFNALGEKAAWLNTSDKLDGLEVLLKRKNKITLTLNFENNITERTETIRKWLNAAYKTTYFNASTAGDVVKDALGSSSSFETFKQQIVAKINTGETFEKIAQNRDITKGHSKGTAERELQRLYDGYRIKPDTEKALYRLSTIGVIDDYMVDFATKTYTVFATKRSDEIYFQNLRKYVRKYYSEVRADEELEKARKFEGVSAMQKCLFYLTEFVYREIAKKRFEGIDVMKSACELGKQSGSEAFREFIDLYFNSKYARQGYEANGKNKSLLDRTDKGLNEDISWVWEFIEVVEEDKSGSHINNLKHLRGACTRLLVDKPDNAVFHLLKAFSFFILDPDNTKLMDEASTSFAKGFLKFQSVKKWTFDEVLAHAELFKKYVLQFSKHKRIQEIMDNEIAILSIKIHAQWLESFNLKFLKEYEPGSTYTS